MLKWYVHAASYVYCGVAVVALLFFVAGQASTNIWLSIWSNDAAEGKAGDDDLLRLRLGVYGGLGMTQGYIQTHTSNPFLLRFVAGISLCFLAVIFTAIFSIFLAIASVRSARILHNKLLSNILKCPLSFFDTTPLGRILNRFLPFFRFRMKRRTALCTIVL